MAARRAKQLYFTRRDDDLWDAINRIPDGDQNHEIRRALRFCFLGEGTWRGMTADFASKNVDDTQKLRENDERKLRADKRSPDADDALNSVGLPDGMFGKF